ncbi:conserved hypothetical protein [Acidovorax delafieldii 2AN]|uniref:Uncharacterized protein n=1 Tax=Acidovorax delafieldii 2AN TaxID=573060 RepID=C5SZW5_ACIDE|nr:hypothetical protein [Acidovorax delafieldii]EER62281.1 conserved hypothetical protein [Acidovorax delafieldii 2AN]
MPIAPTTLLSLQQAGESLYAARQAFAQEVQHNASRVVGIVASEPFSNDADRAYGQLRTIARMAHELQAMEEQLKALYGAAMELTAPETPVLVALSDRHSRTRAHPNATGNEGAEDVVVKPALKKQSPKKRAATKVGTEPASQPQRLSANDEKVLAHLRQVLDRRGWKTFTQASIAQGAGIPLGSVGLAIRRVIAAGAIREGQKGRYRLV